MPGFSCFDMHHAGTPMDVDFDEIKNGLLAVRGVKSVHNLGIWSLTLNKTAVAAHLVLGKGVPELCLELATYKFLLKVTNFDGCF